MSLTDWAFAGSAALCCAGLAVMVASLSWSRWRSPGAPLDSMRTLASFHGGLALLCAGLLFGARTTGERVLWLLLLASLAARVLYLVRKAGGLGAAQAGSGPGRPLGLRAKAGAPVSQVQRSVLQAEPWLVLALAPFLLFPTRFTIWLVPLLALPWIVRRRVYGRFTARTPLDGATVLLAAMLPVSLWASMDLQRSMPKLYGIVLGVAICYAIVNNVRRPSAAWSVGLAMAWLGVAVTALALLGTDWGEPGPIRLPLEYSGIARLLTRMGGSLSVGFNPNEVGGALTLFVPFVISLLVLGLRHGGTAMGQGALRWDSGRLPRLARHRLMPTMLALGLLPMLVTLALTQSRAAWLGTGAGLLVIASFGPRWLRATVAIVVVAGCLALCWLGPGSVADWLLAVDSDRTIAPRFDIWLRAVHMMQDMPYTGVGLNMFSQTVNSLYPLLTVPPEKVLELTHAHNVLLQVAVDVGLLGLVAYLALLLGVGASWVYSWRHLASRPMRALTVGLLSSMVAYHVYGLADCLTLGAKPGVFIWAQWGLMATLANLSMSVESTAGAE